MVGLMENMSKEEYKALVKEAIGEWLDAKYSQFGRWTIHGILAMVLGTVVMYLVTHGYIK